LKLQRTQTKITRISAYKLLRGIFHRRFFHEVPHIVTCAVKR
jgi:hypothetical protein